MTKDNIPEFTVTTLSQSIRNTLESEFEYVRVKGELGRVSRPASGHVYFDLKDNKSILSSVVWRGTKLTKRDLIEEGNEELYKDLGPLPSNKDNNSGYYYPSLEVRSSSFRQPRKSYGRSVRQDRAEHHSSALARYHARRSSSRSSSSWQQNQRKNISPRYESDYTTEGSSSPESNYSNNLVKNQIWSSR